MIFNILYNTTELWMTKYIIPSRVTLYKNPSDQTVTMLTLALLINRAYDSIIQVQFFSRLTLESTFLTNQAWHLIIKLAAELTIITTKKV